jgi:polyferredoxin
LEGTIHYLPFLVVLGLAVVTYRPFCYALCPVGLVTHWLEQIGLFRITLHRKTCVDCDLCVKKSLCPVVPEMLKETALRPDCFACTRCTGACPKSAFVIGTRRTVGTAEPKKGKKKAA